MSIEQDGFLSADMGPLIARHRKNNAGWFALATRLNKLGLQLYASSTMPRDDNRALLVGALFCRALSNFEGSLIMAERGMAAEAGTLARACLETVFYMGAAATDAGFLDDLVRDDKAHKRGIARSLVSLGEDRQGCTPAELESVSPVLDQLQNDNLSGLKMKEVAGKAGLSDIHDLIYSQLSASAAHPKASALEMYAKLDASGEMIALQWGPNGGSVADSVNHACIAFLHALKIAAGVLENPGTERQVDSCLREYELLAAPQTST